MKEEDVPQDAGAVYEGQLRRVTFAVDAEGAYRGVASLGWEAEIGATAVSSDRNNERIATAWEQVQAGERAPIAYHMRSHLLDPRTLAIEVGTWTWRVRRHLRPTVWSRLSAVWKQRYAAVLGMPLNELERIPERPETIG